MPTPLAQELLDIIIGHVHDKPTLKFCALASSRLHTLSQRSLFSSLRISLASPSQAPTTSYREVNECFLQSPRLAGYVTTLTVEFRFASSVRDVSVFRSLLGRLKRVRYCTLGNGFYSSWATPLSAPILDFILHQNLVELHIRHITWIPPATLAAFFCATQTLGLHGVMVDLTLEDVSTIFPDVKVEYLRITNSNTALDNLCRRQFAPLAANVRRMWITEDSRYDTFKFTPEIAGRLEYLRVEWPSAPTTAALVEIRFSYTLGKKIIRKCYFHAGTLEAVAVALEKCPGTPRISWYLSVEGGSARKERELVKFTALLQAGLPHIHKQGRLYVQNRAFADDWSP
ncbi:hypothetical protein GGX14DRAFT_609607 [Mycena pura]|uniref:Uncharacterized protein n=1 Tax=Mycena pura TaxID=153505 RepID=A0AAD6VMW3_9AGAR|nr:hypothetical protein GGX14DRAFT_609607 [Mycena pura]